MSVNDQVLDYIKQQGQASPKELSAALKVSESSISKSLAALVISGQVVKTGQGRTTIYKIKEQAISESSPPALRNDTQSPTQTAPQGFLNYWSSRFKLDPQFVAEGHNEMYQRVFGYPYGIYCIPWGLTGKVVDIILWVLAFTGAWVWTISNAVGKTLIILIIAVAIGFYFYHKNYRVPLESNALQEQLAQSQQQLAQTKDQLNVAQRQLTDNQNEFKKKLEQQQVQSQDQEKNLQGQIKALQSQVQTFQAKEEEPVDYQGIVQHPLSNDSINFFKGLFKGKEQASSRSPIKTFGDDKNNQELQALRQKLQKEEAINNDLQMQLRAALAQKGQNMGQQSAPIKFDESGERVK